MVSNLGAFLYLKIRSWDQMIYNILHYKSRILTPFDLNKKTFLILVLKDMKPDVIEKDQKSNIINSFMSDNEILLANGTFKLNVKISKHGP